MKKMATILIALALCLLVVSPSLAANPVRISMVYGGGGNSGATYTNDFVELFNSSSSPVSIGGWSLQYGSATGACSSNLGTCTNCLTVLPANAVIPACGYYLIQLAAQSTTVGAPLPVTPDYAVLPNSSANNMSGSSGTIALKANSTTSPCVPQNAFVDLVGYGTACCYEGAAAAGGLSSSTMAIRKLGGMQDGDANGTDFTVGAGVPRNSSSPLNQECLIVPTIPSSWGTVKSIYR